MKLDIHDSYLASISLTAELSRIEISMSTMIQIGTMSTKGRQSHPMCLKSVDLSSTLINYNQLVKGFENLLKENRITGRCSITKIDS